MTHPIGSPYARDQISQRASLLNEKRLQPEGEYVLYWMQSTQRLEDNWALRYATFEADRVGKPLLIHHAIDASYPYASDRFHTFMMQGAQELAARAARLGLTYRFALHPRRDDRTIEHLAKRAAVVVTDDFPTEGVNARSQRLPSVPNAGSSGRFGRRGGRRRIPSRGYAARTIRPKLARLIDHALEVVDDRPPRRALPASVLESLDVPWHDVARCDVAAEVARCQIDHDVNPVASRGGLRAARARLAAFVADGLHAYAQRRRNPSDEGGSSRLSPYLHYGMISPLEVVRAVRAGASPEASEAFLNEMLTWRELSLNFCLRNPHHASLAALPEWVQRSMRAHRDDQREVTYSSTPSSGRRRTTRSGTRVSASSSRRGRCTTSSGCSGKVGHHVDADVRGGARIAPSPERQVRARRPGSEQLRRDSVVLRQVRSPLCRAARVGNDPTDVARSGAHQIPDGRVPRAVGGGAGGGLNRPPPTPARPAAVPTCPLRSGR